MTPPALRLLLIEDSPEDLSQYLDLFARLTEFRFDIETAATGAEALSLFDRRDFDCILLDYQLPDMDGIRILEKMAERGRPELPVVMVTGQGDEVLAVRALRSGAADYVIKSSLTPETLYRAVQNAVHRHRTSERFRAERARFEHEQRERIEAQQREILALADAKKQHDRLDSFFKQVPSPVAVTQGQIGVLELINEPMRELIAYGGHAHCTLATVAECFGPEVDKITRLVYQTQKSFRASEFEIERDWRAGQRQTRFFQMTVDPFRETDQTVSGTILMLSDVTDAVSARRLIEASEQRALDSEQRLRVATHASKVGIWEIEFESLKTWRNAEHDEVFGFDEPREWSVAVLLEHVIDEDRGRVAHAFYRALGERSPLDVEFRVAWPDRTLHWVWMRAGVDRGAGGVMRLAGTSVDVTERKERERDLNDARNSAVAANDTKTMFLANMSHEIRTPLNAIIGFTQLISSEVTSTDERRRFAETVQRNGRMLMQIIDDILDLSKIEAGKMEVCPEPTRLGTIVDDVIMLYRPAAVAKGVTLEVRHDAGLPDAVMTDPIRLRQIVSNVVSNAVKFTARGTIEIHVRHLVAESARPGWISFVVADTGIGISDEQQLRLFQPFAQADGTMTRKFGGTGLGLMLSRRLAKLLGGTFFLVRSRPDAGSTFELRIPVVPLSVDIPVAAPVVAALQNGALRDITVLLVDDSEDSRFLARRYLEIDQARVIEAASAAEALRVFETNRIDAVVTDVQMPEMDGHELTRELRRRGVTVPIIGLTAHAMAEDRQKSLESGMNAHVGKPLRPEDLIESIAREIRPSS